MKKIIIGYTAGVYDMFHVGHLNLLTNAKGLCDKLVVGVTTDELAQYKGVKPTIPFEDRIRIIKALKCVDSAIPQKDMDKVKICKKLGASMLFVGDDWYDTEKWKEYEKELAKINCKVVYFPYTEKISSSKLRKVLKEKDNL